MKILVLTNLYPPHYLGGYELICWMVVRELRQCGHDLRVLTSDHRVPGAETQPEEGAVERRLKIHGYYGHPWRGIWGLAKLEAFNNAQLQAAIARWSPDLVYIWNMGGLSKSMLLRLQTMRVPTVFYVSDHWIARGLQADVWLSWWNQNRSHKQWLARRILEWSGCRRRWDRASATGPLRDLRFPRITFCSRALRDLTASSGFPVSHGAIIYAPVDLRRFGAAQPVARRMERLLFVGRLSPDKGVMTALRALALLRGKFAGRFNIYGHGDSAYEAELKAFARHEQLPVEFRSARLAEMPGVYRQHDCLVFPSEWVEPFALTPLEAMASGLPVIGTTTGGSAELFRDRENCLTYRAGDAAQLANRILTLANDDALRRRCAAAGFCQAREKYSLPIIVDQIEDYLRETIECGNGQSSSCQVA